MSSSYRENEKAIMDIVKRGVESMTPGRNVKLVVYYKTGKTSQLVIKNNSPKKTTDLKKSCLRVQVELPSWRL